MINTSGFLSVIDHGVTVHWENGPTLHKMVAQVRYRLAEDVESPLEVLRVGASQRCADWDADAEGAQCFVAANHDVSAQWLWREAGAGWAAQLIIRNIGEAAIFADGLDIILIDAQRNGLFRLGTTPDQWRTQTAPGVLAVQPLASDQGRQPAILLRALTPIRILPWLETTNTQFLRFSARQEMHAQALSANEVVSSANIWIVAGDDIDELLQLRLPVLAESTPDNDDGLMETDFQQPWYHGSPMLLTVLAIGSTITQDRELARVFSHKPTLVSQDIDDTGQRMIKHTGSVNGYLHRIVEVIGPDDIYPHPYSTMGTGQEWLTARELQVEMIEPTILRIGEHLSDSEIARLKTRTDLGDC